MKQLVCLMLTSIKFLLTTLNLGLTINFLGEIVDVHSSIVGSNTTHGFHIASRRMGVSVFLVFFFATFGYHHSNPGVLVRRPLTSFAKALELLRKHTAKDYHKTAVVRADEFLKVMSNQQPDIRHRITQTLSDRVEKNRHVLASILRIVEFCGRQNIALRGHRDNATDLERDSLAPVNHGNFWALMNFRI